MPEDRQSGTDRRTRIDGPHADRVLAEIAARQHGVASRRQLAASGLTSSLLKRRLVSGHLVLLHRGVYAVGHDRLRREGRWLAAVLAVGPGAALSHASAGALHGIRPANGTRVDVSVATARRDQAGIRIHGRCVLAAEDVVAVDAIPVTTVARTLVDLAGVIPRHQLAKALSEAERLGKLDVAAIEAALHRTRGRRGPGHARIRAALAEHQALGSTLTRSELEDRFVTLLDAQEIPRPRLNQWIHGIEVDALWSEQRVVVELDGYAFHTGRAAFQRDRVKANDLLDFGYRVRRFTHRDVVRDGADVAARLRRLLGAEPR